MPSVVLYLHVHQPFRIKNYNVFSVGQDRNYFDTDHDRLSNLKVLNKVSEKSYLPFNALLLRLLNDYPEFKVSMSISGVVLEQFEKHRPDVLLSFQKLVDTGKVELINETYYHSLSFIFNRDEFESQVKLHGDTYKRLFGYTATSFRNTELIYNNEVGLAAESLGFKAILAEGVDRYLGWRSPNFIYQPEGAKSIRLMLKNYRMSDDIAFRFSNKSWEQYPLTAEKYASWLRSVHGNGYVTNLFMDYETFGEHQWEDSGIFEFMKVFPRAVINDAHMDFSTITEAATKFPVSGTVDMPDLTSWADIERDLSAWRSNPLQETALTTLYQMRNQVFKTHDQKLIDDWRKLSTSDHFYYMCTKWFSDGDVHTYFSPNTSPYEAYTNYMNILHDMRIRAYDETA